MYAHFVVPGLVIMNSKTAHLVWLPRDQWYRRYRLRKASKKFWTCIVILTLETAISFLHVTPQLIIMYRPIQCGCKKISSSADMVESHIWLWALTVTLSLNQSPCLTLWPTMMHQRSKFGYRRFSIWGGIVQMNIHWNSEPLLWPWPWPQQSNPIFSQDNPAKNDVLANQA